MDKITNELMVKAQKIIDQTNASTLDDAKMLVETANQIEVISASRTERKTKWAGIMVPTLVGIWATIWTTKKELVGVIPTTNAAKTALNMVLKVFRR